MDYDREQELRRQAAAGDAQAGDARRQLTLEDADGRWQAGDRGAALRVLHNAGVEDLIGFCRERGLTVDEARAEIRNANIDWS